MMTSQASLFFGPEFKIDFTWEGVQLRVGSVRPVHQKEISEGLHDLSAQSIRHRFLGTKKEFSQEELAYLTELDGINHYAIGIEELSNSERGIAIVRMVRSFKNPEESEVAITIIDEYQKMGLGTFLLRLMILAASERGIKILSFTFMPTNEGINKLIHRLGQPIMRTRNHDSIQLILDLTSIDYDFIKSQLAKILPEIENFHLKI